MDLDFTNQIYNQICHISSGNFWSSGNEIKVIKALEITKTTKNGENDVKTGKNDVKLVKTESWRPKT